ncbi:MAG: LCP family protein [Lachnospiraceae bacterium]|nr:LCP family protein [Lachnospiraceae bacterium]
MSKNPGKKKHHGRRILLTILIILAVILGGVFFLFRHFYSKSNYIDAKKAAAAAEQAYAALDASVRSQIEETGLTDSEQAEVDSLLGNAAAAEKTTDDIFTVLIIMLDPEHEMISGSDSTYALMGFNKTKNRAISIRMDDNLALNIEGYGVRKLSAAYAIGGAPLLQSSIEKNFGITVDYFACIDVKGMQEGIDKLDDLEFNVGDITKAVNELMTYVTHNVPTTMLLTLTAQIPKLVNSTPSSGELELPIRGNYTTRGELLVPDQPVTNQRIQMLLQGDE